MCVYVGEADDRSQEAAHHGMPAPCYSLRFSIHIPSLRLYVEIGATMGPGKRS